MESRKDANQNDIVEELEAAYCSVEDLHKVGGGVPDILVGHNIRNFLFEIKVEGEYLRPNQEKWHDIWRGQAITIWTAHEALVYMDIEEGMWCVKFPKEFLTNTSNQVLVFDTWDDAKKAVDYFSWAKYQIRVHIGHTPTAPWTVP